MFVQRLTLDSNQSYTTSTTLDNLVENMQLSFQRIPVIVLSSKDARTDAELALLFGGHSEEPAGRNAAEEERSAGTTDSESDSATNTSCESDSDANQLESYSEIEEESSEDIKCGSTDENGEEGANENSEENSEEESRESADSGSSIRGEFVSQKRMRISEANAQPVSSAAQPLPTAAVVLTVPQYKRYASEFDSTHIVFPEASLAPVFGYALADFDRPVITTDTTVPFPRLRLCKFFIRAERNDRLVALFILAQQFKVTVFTRQTARIEMFSRIFDLNLDVRTYTDMAVQDGGVGAQYERETRRGEQTEREEAVDAATSSSSGENEDAQVSSEHSSDTALEATSSNAGSDEECSGTECSAEASEASFTDSEDSEGSRKFIDCAVFLEGYEEVPAERVFIIGNGQTSVPQLHLDLSVAGRFKYRILDVAKALSAAAVKSPETFNYARYKNINN